VGAQELVDVLDIELLDSNLYRGRNLSEPGFRRIYGGQVCAQAVIAAARTVPEGRHLHSLHGYFLRSGQVDRPVLYPVDRDRDGGSFSARHVVARQNGEAIFTLVSSFHVDEPGGEYAATVMPAGVPEPEEIGDTPDVPVFASFDVRAPRVPDVPWMPGTIALPRMWIRRREPIAAGRLLHTAIGAFVSDITCGWGVATTPDIPFGGSSLDHAVWIHQQCDMNDWHLIDSWPVAASGARGLYEGAIFRRDGTLVASFAQEALLRPPRPDAST
jgi:acyl-CoA thioesterase II